MALIKCTECGQEISDMATACPKCGKPTGVKLKTKPKLKIPLYLWQVITSIVGIFLATGGYVMMEKAPDFVRKGRPETVSTAESLLWIGFAHTMLGCLAILICLASLVYYWVEAYQKRKQEKDK